MSDEPLIAHSLAEAYLYLTATPCASCGKGPLQGADATPLDEKDKEAGVRIPVTCGACDDVTEPEFTLPNGLCIDPNGGPAAVNPTGDPSRIIDVGQWLTLFRAITELAAHEANKVAARELGIEAAMCLGEALKFYDDPESELPPEEAFFYEPSRAHVRDYPEHFARERLLALRAKLPSLSAMKRVTRESTDGGRATRKKRWWRAGR